ncbi:MAG: VWA domain-containing protein, partial [Planctomycetes bacterium]|nr:VWA domain-containing protein [Planctomycetota bacterium]
SGRSIGAEPARWSEWWEGARAGRIALPADLTAAGIESTSAAFFGLHAVTDRVLFVVDGSGSMRTAFDTSGRSRHDEAIEQLTRFLRQAGPDTRFGVALFSRSGEVWRNHLVPASEANLELARSWLEKNEPDGETRLFEGLRAGLGLDERGRLELERSEADTVIVLCDGATSEGPGWVARWLERENERAQLVFHCVQIGNQGNGTLEALAEGTGGELVRVGG